MASNVAASSTVSSNSSSDSMLGALGIASLFGLASYSAYESDCCGIVGVVGKSGTAREFLLEGLSILQNRGYDSAGMATLSGMKGVMYIIDACYLLFFFLQTHCCVT
jgi:glucosamine--fructose-6-phosphate aminotransferase (isomerizing)